MLCACHVIGLVDYLLGYVINSCQQGLCSVRIDGQMTVNGI